jgi:hypothetical protein
MVVRDFSCLALALALVVGPAPSSSPAQSPGSGWEAIAVGPGKLAIPKGWHNFRGIRPPMIIYRIGDGIGIPLVDETGAPLQMGMTVVKRLAAKGSATEIMDGLVEEAKQAPRLELVGEATVEDVTLADGTTAKLLTAEFIKEGRRRSLQLKLVAKDGQGTAWIVSGFLVSGKESQWPKPGSKYAGWLRAHVASLSLDAEKFDSGPVDAAHKLIEE